MANSENRSDREHTQQFHPLVYWTIVGLCLWLVASVWGFAAPGDTGLALTVVSLFVAVAVGIPVVLWGISRGARSGRRDAPATLRFGDWLGRDFEAWSGRQRGRDAAVEVLLPIAAVAFGMSAFALALHLAV
jgi:hypothetical protein